VSVSPESMPDELANAKRLIDAWSKLSWTQQERELEKVRAQNLAALQADKSIHIANLPNGQALVGTPWEIYREKSRLGYLKSWERMLGTLSNIEGGVGGTVGYAIGGEEGAEIGARLFDDPANALGSVPESSRETGGRGTGGRGTGGRGTGPVEFQHGSPLVPEAVREVLKEPLAPPIALDPRLPPEPASKPVEPPPAPKEWKPPEYARAEPNRKPPPPPEVSNRKVAEPPEAPNRKPPSPPKEPPTVPTKGTANRFGDENKPRKPAKPVVPFGSIDLPLAVLPSKNAAPRKAPAKGKKPELATVAAAPAQQPNTAQAGAPPKKKESAPKAPAVAPSNKPPANSAASDANKLVDDVARGLSKPVKPAKAAKPSDAIDEGLRPSPVPDAAKHEKDSAKTLEAHIAEQLKEFARKNNLPEPLQDKSFKEIAKKLAEQARKNPRWNVPDNIEKALEKQLQPTREALLNEVGFGDIINVLRTWYRKKAAAARADLNQVQSRSSPREKKQMRDLISDLEKTEPFPGYEEENAPEAEDVWSRNDLNDEQKAAYDNLKNSLRLQRDLEGTLRAKISRTKPDNLMYSEDLSFSSVVDATEKIQEPAHQLKLAVDREVANRLLEELTKYSESTVPSPREVPETHSALEILPGGGKNYIPTSLRDIRAKMAEFLRWRLSKVNVTEGVTPDVVDAAQKLGTDRKKSP
jgi:DNA-binding TFAR19-related protein (PDSD5 family)